ncbi:hypothetical protein IBTHAUMO2_240095 [Nitrosopumilaceae archaeon]|nr:hypothetical protein IBTHAUMO2_240095 [Nitrosopumilaceae archaeon]
MITCHIDDFWNKATKAGLLDSGESRSIDQLYRGDLIKSKRTGDYQMVEFDLKSDGVLRVTFDIKNDCIFL